jgi:regulator of sigma E protease
VDPFTFLYILLLVTMLTVLVSAHEYGHFLFARIFKMEVEEFAIGFGRPPWTFMRKKGTAFTVRPWPLGGFVRVKGMVPEDDGSEREIEGGFYSKPAWQRVIVFLAGPVFSILAGLAILIPLYSLNGVKTLGARVGDIRAESPAAKSELKKGDLIVAVDGVPVKSFLDIVGQVRDKAGQNVEIRFDRNGAAGVTSIVPELEANPSPVLDSYVRGPKEFRRQAKIGVAPDPTERLLVKIPFSEAVLAGLMWPWDMAKGIVRSLLSPSTFKDNVGGPGTIVKETYAAAKDGMDTFVQLAALLSISLGIFNLLPFGFLDGGQIVMNLIEVFRGGKRPSMRFLIAFQSVGFVLIGLLIFGAIASDISRFFGNKPEVQQKP